MLTNIVVLIAGSTLICEVKHKTSLYYCKFVLFRNTFTLLSMLSMHTAITKNMNLYYNNKERSHFHSLCS